MTPVEKNDGIALVQYFEHDQFVGTRRTYCCSASEAGVSFSAYWPHTAYFCPKCGDLWAREIFTYEFDYAPRVRSSWAVESRPCVSCGDGQLLSGHHSLDNVDSALLTRELLALLEGLSYEHNCNFPSDHSRYGD